MHQNFLINQYNIYLNIASRIFTRFHNIFISVSAADIHLTLNKKIIIIWIQAGPGNPSESRSCLEYKTCFRQFECSRSIETKCIGDCDEIKVSILRLSEGRERDIAEFSGSGRIHECALHHRSFTIQPHYVDRRVVDVRSSVLRPPPIYVSQRRVALFFSQFFCMKGRASSLRKCAMAVREWGKVLLRGVDRLLDVSAHQ